MATHTPGPYIAEGPDWAGDYNIITDRTRDGAIAGVVANGRKADEVRANALLFCAAPEMLAICDELWEWTQPGRPQVGVIELLELANRARLACLKAKGESI